MLSGLLYWTALGLRLPGLYQAEHCQCMAPPGAGIRVILQAGVRGEGQDVHSGSGEVAQWGPENLWCAGPLG